MARQRRDHFSHLVFASPSRSSGTSLSASVLQPSPRLDCRCGNGESDSSHLASSNCNGRANTQNSRQRESNLLRHPAQHPAQDPAQGVPIATKRLLQSKSYVDVTARERMARPPRLRQLDPKWHTGMYQLCAVGHGNSAVRPMQHHDLNEDDTLLPKAVIIRGYGGFDGPLNSRWAGTGRIRFMRWQRGVGVAVGPQQLRLAELEPRASLLTSQRSAAGPSLGKTPLSR